jgi:serine dehydrogenase proteinase
VITLIHRQETMSLFGFPLVRYIGTFSRLAAPHANRLATP